MLHTLQPKQKALGLVISNIAALAFMAGGYGLAYLFGYFFNLPIPALELIPALIVAGTTVAINTLLASIVGLRPVSFHELNQSQADKATVSVIPPLVSAALALGAGFFALSWFAGFPWELSLLSAGIGLGCATVATGLLTISKLFIQTVAKGIYALGKRIKKFLPDTDLIRLKTTHTGLAIIFSDIAALAFVAAGLTLTWFASTLFGFPFPDITPITGAIIAGSTIATNTIISWFNGFKTKDNLPNSSESYMNVPFIPAMITATLVVFSSFFGIGFFAGVPLAAAAKTAGIAAGITAAAAINLYAVKTLACVVIGGVKSACNTVYEGFTGLIMNNNQQQQLMQQQRQQQQLMQQQQYIPQHGGGGPNP